MEMEKSAPARVPGPDGNPPILTRQGKAGNERPLFTGEPPGRFSNECPVRDAAGTSAVINHGERDDRECRPSDHSFGVVVRLVPGPGLREKCDNLFIPGLPEITVVQTDGMERGGRREAHDLVA